MELVDYLFALSHRLSFPFFFSRCKQSFFLFFSLAFPSSLFEINFMPFSSKHISCASITRSNCSLGIFRSYFRSLLFLPTFSQLALVFTRLWSLITPTLIISKNDEIRDLQTLKWNLPFFVAHCSFFLKIYWCLSLWTSSFEKSTDFWWALCDF